MNDEPQIALRDVSFCYLNAVDCAQEGAPDMERKNLSHIDLEIAPGECVVLTGASGCGKTTLTRLLNGLAENFYEGRAEGEVLLFGKNLNTQPIYEIGRQVGSIFQDPKSQFFASITEDEIAFGCENYGVPREEINARVACALAMIKGDDLCGKRIYPMSSGEKQKIAIASVHAVAPKIYVFDEPSANLDMASVEALAELMRWLKAQGHTLVIAEHRLYYLTDFADRFLYMQDGCICESWTSRQFLALSDDDRHARGLRAADLSRVTLLSAANSTRLDAPIALEVKDLCFSYRKRRIFSGLSFAIHQGEIVAVIGHNGVGKTTLARLLTGLEKEDGGSIRFDGRAVPRRKRRQEAYFVMQNTDCQLFADSVLDELRLSCPLSDEEARALLELYGLDTFADVHPATLSGGQKQRLTLAVSDLCQAPVLILDEPTSGLDFRNMTRISAHLKALAEEKKRTLLIITHDYEFAAMTATHVLHLMDDGAEIYSLCGHVGRLYNDLLHG